LTENFRSSGKVVAAANKVREERGEEEGRREKRRGKRRWCSVACSVVCTCVLYVLVCCSKKTLFSSQFLYSVFLFVHSS
jgi:hypothetical protein